MTMTETANGYFYKPTYGVDRGQTNFDSFVGKLDVCDSKFGRVLHLGDPVLGDTPADWNNGTGDVQSYLQAALDYANNNNYGALYVPSGTYKLNKRVALHQHIVFCGSGCGPNQTKFVIPSGFSTSKSVASGGYAPFTTYDGPVSAHNVFHVIMSGIDVDLSDGADATALYGFWARHNVGCGIIENCMFESDSTSNLHGGIVISKYTTDDNGDETGAPLDHNFFGTHKILFQRLGSETGALYVPTNNNAQAMTFEKPRFVNCKLDMDFGGQSCLFTRGDWYGPGIFGNALKTDNTGYWPRIIFRGGGYSVFRDNYFDSAGSNIVFWRIMDNSVSPNYNFNGGFTIQGVGEGFHTTSTDSPYVNIANIFPNTLATGEKSGDTYIVRGYNATIDPYYMTAGKYIWAEVTGSPGWRKKYQIDTATYSAPDTTLTFVGAPTLAADTSVNLYRDADYPQTDIHNEYRNFWAKRHQFMCPVELAVVPADPGTFSGAGKLYIRLNGSGKQELCVLFDSGSPQILATEA